MGDEAIRVGERPRREGVRREARVHEQQRAFDQRIREVRKERTQLWRRQHPFVDDCSRRQ